MTRRCCGRCRAIPGTCGDHACQCHQESPEARTARLAREFVDEALAARRKPIPRTTEAAIIAAHAGIDSAVEVARRHKVSIRDVRELWRTANKDD